MDSIVDNQQMIFDIAYHLSITPAATKVLLNSVKQLFTRRQPENGLSQDEQAWRWIEIVLNRSGYGYVTFDQLARCMLHAA